MRSKESDGFVGFISWVSVVGLALGVMALVIVTSAINGFQREIIKTASGMNSDVILYSRSESLQNPEQVEEKIRKIIPEVRSIAPCFVTQLMVSGPKGVAGSILEGVDLEKLGQVSILPTRLNQGRLPLGKDEVVVGSALANKVGAKLGDEIRLVVPYSGGEGQVSGSPKARPYKVVGTFTMGHYDYDSKYTIADLSSVQEFLEQQGRVTSFKIKLTSPDLAIRAAKTLNDHFGFPFRAKDWSLLNKNLLYAIQLEKTVISVLLTTIILVAGFNVASALMLFVQDKTKDLSILRAVGFSAKRMGSLILAIGFSIGVIGCGLGVLAGVAGYKFLETTKLIHLPAEIYILDRLPVEGRPFEILAICIGALLIVWMAALIPARVAMAKPPLEGIRYE